jgi:hypothetical protein
VGEQQDHPTVDRGHRGLVAAEQQPRAEQRDIVDGQFRVDGGGSDQIGDYVVARLSLLEIRQWAHVLTQFPEPGPCACGISQMPSIVRPAAEVLSVGIGDAEQLADDQRRKWKRHHLM